MIEGGIVEVSDCTNYENSSNQLNEITLSFWEKKTHKGKLIRQRHHIRNKYSQKEGANSKVSQLERNEYSI